MIYVYQIFIADTMKNIFYLFLPQQEVLCTRMEELNKGTHVLNLPKQVNHQDFRAQHKQQLNYPADHMDT